MSKHEREIKKILVDICAAHGASMVFEYGGKHPAAVITRADGVRFKMPFAGSTSDHRSKLNLRSSMRRHLTS